MSWITTRLLAYALGASWLVILGVSTYAYTQHQVAQREEAKAALASGKLDIALAANQVSTDTIKRLEAERDSYLLKRAAEKAEADRLVEQSRNTAKRVAQELAAERKRIHALSLSENCYAVMQAPICPEVERELRTP